MLTLLRSFFGGLAAQYRAELAMLALRRKEGL